MTKFFQEPYTSNYKYHVNLITMFAAIQTALNMKHQFLFTPNDFQRVQKDISYLLSQYILSYI